MSDIVLSKKQIKESERLHEEWLKENKIKTIDMSNQEEKPLPDLITLNKLKEYFPDEYKNVVEKPYIDEKIIDIKENDPIVEEQEQQDDIPAFAKKVLVKRKGIERKKKNKK